MSRRRDRLRRQGRVFGPLADLVRSRPCVVPKCYQPGDPHHVRARGHGGSKEDWLPIIERSGPRNRVHEYKGIIGNLAPLCDTHRNELHQCGPETFAGRHGVSLSLVATQIGHEFSIQRPEAFAKLDEIYAPVALRKPELCFPPEERKSV